jgi:hypothetical protein
VEPLFLQALREAAARYDQLAGTGLTAREPREIVRAAEHGRIDTLFAAQHPTGSSADGGGVPVSDEGSGLQDLLERAASITLIKGGAVYILPAGEVPGGGGVAAVFRY